MSSIKSRVYARQMECKHAFEAGPVLPREESSPSGKTRCLIEPAIRQITEQGASMLVYDFKYPALTSYAYAQFRINSRSYPAGTQFCQINFSDLKRSHRCNVIAPESIGSPVDAAGIAETILKSADHSQAERGDKFWLNSATNFLSSLVWFLREYEGGRYCTLPHVIELSAVPYDKLFPILATIPALDSKMSSFAEAYAHGTMDMVDGQIAAVKMPLSKLISPDIYYSLSGDDVGLDINNPAAPRIFCLGGNP